MNFPGNAKCVVLLTFDFDAELMWNSYPRTPGYTQRGQYGANVGVPRILSLLENHGIKVTFFWPGANAERYPELLKKVYTQGHEIGHHGYLHEKVSELEEEGKSARSCSWVWMPLKGVGVRLWATAHRRRT